MEEKGGPRPPFSRAPTVGLMAAELKSGLKNIVHCGNHPLSGANQ
jgi:hypothetical protein